MLVYSFDIADASQPVAVKIAYEPTTIGALPVQVATASGERLQFTQFVFP